MEHCADRRCRCELELRYDGNAVKRSALREAADFTAAVRALWDSWDDGALVGDIDTGVWADINHIHAVNYAGRHYTTTGPMQVWRSPQRQPVLVQAGSSPQGRDFAARVAEIVFSMQTRFEDAVAYYADIKNHARQHGRDPRHLAILPGLSLVLAGRPKKPTSVPAAVPGVVFRHGNASSLKGSLPNLKAGLISAEPVAL